MTDEKDMEFAGAGGDPDGAFPGAGGQDDQPMPSSQPPVGVVNPGDSSEEDAEAAMLRMLEDLPQENRSTSPDDINFGSAQVSRAEFQQLQQPAGAGSPRNLDLLMDVDLPVQIELGRTKLSISEILALGPGSVVALPRKG